MSRAKSRDYPMHRIGVASRLSSVYKLQAIQAT